MPPPAPDDDAELRGRTDVATPRAAAGPADAEQLVELNALLGRGTSYTGKLHFEGRIRIEGRFSGEIRGEDILVVGEGAEVDGDIRVGVCIVTGGKVRADIRARDAIELYVPAEVVGDLHAPAIFIDRGVQFEGSCKMAPLDATPPPTGAVELPKPTPPPAKRSSPAAAIEPTLPGAPPAVEAPSTDAAVEPAAPPTAPPEDADGSGEPPPT